jgi:hypothetical protein
MLDRAASRLQAMVGVSVFPLENQISSTTREQIPLRLEPLAPLATHLRLLGLAGADRAQTLADTGRDLLQQDGAAAISLLGAVDCTFPEDLDWAKKASAALANGAERDIQEARTTIREAQDLDQLFPGMRLVEAKENDTLRDTFASDTFYTRLADLRGVTRLVRGRVARVFRERLTVYDADLIQGRTDLEALPDWLRLSDDDRLEIANRLANPFPPSPAEGEEVSCLRLLLIRHNALAGLLQELEREVERRVPRVVRDGDGQEPLDVDLVGLALPVLVTTTDDLDAWLAGIRAALANALAAGAPLRIRIGRQ